MISFLGVFNADLKFLVERFPQAGETLHGLSFEIQPGGKGFNQAVACRRSALTGSQSVSMLTQLGEDNFADMAREFMAQEGIDASNVISTADKPTGTAMIMVEEASAQNMIVISPGAASLLGEKEVSEFGSKILSSRVFVTNFEVPLEAALAGMCLAKKNGVKTILDPAPACALTNEDYHLVDYITPNESEAEILVGFDVNSLEDGERAGRELCSRGVGTAIVTMGKQGVVAVHGGQVLVVPAFELENVVDTTGAGDAFNGCFATRICEGANLEDALKFASAGAALCVQKYGAADAMAARAEIDEFLKQNSR